MFYLLLPYALSSKHCIKEGHVVSLTQPMMGRLMNVMHVLIVFVVPWLVMTHYVNKGHFGISMPIFTM
jgi:uncharacterized membrane protein